MLRLALALLTTLTPAALPAQTAPAPAAAAALTIDTPIEAIVAVPAGKAVLEKEMPTLLTHAMYDSFKSMSLKQLQPYSQGAITDDELARVDAGLKAIKK
ncbi:hypothetical protein FHS95_000745 [Sphingomonas naasensis]|uniref:Uncharacterized protein n=1 Tax=Sphingomonas naasensis TaxID=1344951 RepID=A0A4S1WT66_9SPHN|nr:hypothetical protein [Sphingomonas naasensis]NIJ19076.1 hypothetical protein [Sphingomonas naasensis]TGX46273.1 hypothetical protein E5A74_03715 [Sphingomonas naasensis]